MRTLSKGCFTVGLQRTLCQDGDVLLTVVDAFTDRAFSGNPAAVAIVEEFPSDERMQAIAREMNLSETAFVVVSDDDAHPLRWFTPAIEVDLCGHATLAAAHVLGGRAVFSTRSGLLTCDQHDGWIEMDFPAWKHTEQQLPVLPDCIPSPVWTGIAGDDWLVELRLAGDVVDLEPDQAGVAALGRRALIVTARADTSSEADIVSRVFAPNAGIPEDPVTGSAHCALAPYWAARLGRDELIGWQASERGGIVRMRLSDDRVILGGHAVAVSEVTMLA
jgi:predicted PhzF superfamily epimerase YddE/YHI9